MVDFKTFQQQAVEKLQERCNPNWQPADPKKELPFNIASDDWKWFKRNVPTDMPNLRKVTTKQLVSLGFEFQGDQLPFSFAPPGVVTP